MTCDGMGVVLLVEDNECDVELTREAFELAGNGVQIHHVENGEHCMRFLRKEGSYAEVPTPDLILLDLNMPVMDGRTVLAEIVEDPELCHLPVVVLTTSSVEQDIVRMYRLRCNSYITKPVDFHEFSTIIERLQRYWFSAVVLPTPRQGKQA